MKFYSLFLAAATLLTGNAGFTGEASPVKSDETLPLYNYAGRIDVNHSWDFFLTGSYIYWQPREDGLALGYIFDNNHPETQTSIVNMDFDYHSGFKVGLGVNICRDNWVAYFDYTRLHMKEHTTLSYPEATADNAIAPFWTNDDSSGPISEITAQWKLRYDMFDLKLFRPLYEGCALIADAFLGMKGGWLNQRYISSFFASPYSYSTHARIHSWLVGPQTGLSANYHLGAGFRWFGNSDLGLLYQSLKTTIIDSLSDGSYFINERDQHSQITPNFDFDMGLGWGTYFDKKNWHFDLLAAYEFQYYWNQNRMKQLLGSVAKYSFDPSFMPGKAKDLILHGLTITARIDF